MDRSKPIGRALYLARVGAGLPAAQLAARTTMVFLVALAFGLLTAWVASRVAGEDPSTTVAAVAGAAGAAAAGTAAHLALHGRFAKARAAEFSHMARRLGMAKTSLSETRAALGRLGRAIERAVPEVLAEEDFADTSLRPSPAGAGLGPLASLGNERDQHIARRLLRVARAASFLGGTDLELRPLPLAGPCAEILEQYRRAVGPDHEILYIEDGGGEWLSAPIDRPLFVLLLRELLDNVLEHGGDWSRITVTTEPVSGAILLRVRDDGRGIPSDAVQGIMSGAGSSFHGLGLPIVRAIVEAHGGSFRVESDAGRGTSINLKFPTHA